ncbi:MAG TPA: histidine--tRNA ligase [Candidatus Bipolaricaulota bacterium]|nr:histidine--tRNA ligase [Candidatus Bipolaricaulota bacterium]
MPRRKKTEDTAIKVKSIKTPQLVRGMKDILPVDQKYWRFLNSRVESIAVDYSYRRIETPILENISLFTHAIGKQTDIVEKEMFVFLDKGGDKLVLRPEGTAPIARAYIDHGMLNLPQPVKLYYSGSMFRHERPQSGRLREFHQTGFEIIGDGSPAIDAELILIAYNLFKDLGIEVNVQVNSIGELGDRENYRKALLDYYKNKKASLCVDCKKRILKNPLRLLDCKNPKCAKLKENAPQMVDYLSDDARNHFFRLLEYLDELQIPYNLNQFLVRGMDYYNRTVFEFWEKEDTEGRNALGGGGRYDYLLEMLGGRETPGCGFAVGVERALGVLKEKRVQLPEALTPDIFLAQIGEQARRRAMGFFEELRKSGLRVAANFSKGSLKSQLDLANKLGVKIVLILGQREIVDETILMRDMDSGIQEVVNFKKIINEVKRKLEKH